MNRDEARFWFRIVRTPYRCQCRNVLYDQIYLEELSEGEDDCGCPTLHWDPTDILLRGYTKAAGYRVEFDWCHEANRRKVNALLLAKEVGVDESIGVEELEALRNNGFNV